MHASGLNQSFPRWVPKDKIPKKARNKLQILGLYPSYWFRISENGTKELAYTVTFQSDSNDYQNYKAASNHRGCLGNLWPRRWPSQGYRVVLPSFRAGVLSTARCSARGRPVQEALWESPDFPVSRHSHSWRGKDFYNKNKPGTQLPLHTKRHIFVCMLNIDTEFPRNVNTS